MQLTLALTVLLFLSTPLLTVRRPLPALWLNAARLDQHADRLSRHRFYLLRQGMKMLKTVGGLAWGADPDVRAALGLSPYAPDPGTWRKD